MININSSEGNEFIDSFVTRLKNRYSIDADDMTISEWLETNTTLRKKPFTLGKHHFQRAIADDMHVNMSVIKPSQVGLTEIQLRKTLAIARRMDGIIGIYSMPSDEMRGRLSQQRLKPIIDQDKVFNTEFDAEAVRQKGLLQFGQSFIYMTGAKEGDATSINADFLFNDETDLTDPEMLALFRSRLQGSTYKIHQRFSTPTYPKAGISLDYSDTDQKEYMVKCDCCNEWQSPTFSREFCEIPGLDEKTEDLIQAITMENIGDLDLYNCYVKCRACKAPLDLEREDLREWVATYPTRSGLGHGYRIRPFSTSTLDIEYIIRQLLEYKKRNKIRRFYNTVLGEAYIDESIALSEDMVRQRFSRPNGWQYAGQPVFIGIDVGMVCHVVMGTYTPVDGWLVFHWDRVPATEIVNYVRDLQEHINLAGGTIDRHPYTPTSIDVRAITKGKILPVEYRNPTEYAVRENELTPEETYAQVNRTALLDDVARFIREGKMTFVNYGEQEPLITKHLTDMVRHEEEGEKAVWKKQTGEDHYMHALAFMLSGKKLMDYIISTSNHEVRTLVAATAVDTLGTRSDNLYSRMTNSPRFVQASGVGFNR